MEMKQNDIYTDNHGQKYSYDDLLNLRIEQLEVLSKGVSLEQLEQNKKQQKNKNQEKVKQKTQTNLKKQSFV